MSDSGSSESGPELRKWATRKAVTQASLPGGKQTYKELVAEKEGDISKRKQLVDMNYWGQIKEDHPLKEDTLEFFSSQKTEGTMRKHYEKRWFVINKKGSHMVYFQSKKHHTALGVIDLANCVLEDSVDEKEKKPCFKLTVPYTYTQDLIVKDHVYFFHADSRENHAGWLAILQSLIPKATEAKKSEESDLTTGSLKSASEDEKQTWFKQTQTSRQLGSEIITSKSADDTDQSKKLSIRSSSNASERRASSADLIGNTQAASSKNPTPQLERKEKKEKKEKKVKKHERSASVASTSSIFIAPSMIVTAPTIPKSTFFYNPIIGSSNGVILMCIDKKIELDRSCVHLSWLLAGILGKKEEIEAQKASKGYKPKFIQLHPEGTVPMYNMVVDDKEYGILSSSGSILRYLAAKNGLEDDLYPQKQRESIDKMMDSLGLSQAILENLRTILNHGNVSESDQKAQLYHLNKLLQKIEDHLLETKKTYLFGDKTTLADYYLAGELLTLKVILIDLNPKYTQIRKWLSNMENSIDGWKTLSSEIDSTIDDYIPLYNLPTLKKS